MLGGAAVGDGHGVVGIIHITADITAGGIILGMEEDGGARWQSLTERGHMSCAHVSN